MRSSLANEPRALHRISPNKENERGSEDPGWEPSADEHTQPALCVCVCVCGFMSVCVIGGNPERDRGS